MRTLVILIVIAISIGSCKKKPEEEAVVEEVTIPEMDLSQIPNVNDLLEEAYEEIKQEKTLTLAEKNKKYLAESIIRDSLTIWSEYRAIPANFETVGIENLRSFLDREEISFVEDILEGYSYVDRKALKTAKRRLGLAKPSEIDTILLEMFQVPREEYELLKMLPSTDKIYHENYARKLRDYEIPAEITAYQNSGQSSELFNKLLKGFGYAKVGKPNDFIKKSKRARDAFYELNPGWYGEGGESGNTYIDARKQYIYLPFGHLSFADRVISHEVGYPAGEYSDGALGRPDMSLEGFTYGGPRICNLGIRGVLTLEFTDNSLTDVNGPDLYVFELGAIEPTMLEISKNGEDWINVGQIDGGTALVDIASAVKPGETFNYVRLTDLATPSEVPGADVDAVAAIGGALRLNLDSSVLFDTGKFDLKEEASSALSELLEAIEEIPKGLIIIEGHTDNVGDVQSNQKLSENRANSVSTFLKENLEGAYTFEIKGYGESRPLDNNTKEEGRQKNRRVEILVVPTNQ